MRNTRKRMTIMNVANILAFGVGVDGLISDKEIDELWNSRIDEIMKKGQESNEIPENATIGELFESFAKMLKDEFVS